MIIESLVLFSLIVQVSQIYMKDNRIKTVNIWFNKLLLIAVIFNFIIYEFIYLDICCENRNLSFTLAGLSILFWFRFVYSYKVISLLILIGLLVLLFFDKFIIIASGLHQPNYTKVALVDLLVTFILRVGMGFCFYLLLFVIINFGFGNNKKVKE